MAQFVLHYGRHVKTSFGTSFIIFQDGGLMPSRRVEASSLAEIQTALSAYALDVKAFHGGDVGLEKWAQGACDGSEKDALAYQVQFSVFHRSGRKPNGFDSKARGIERTCLETFPVLTVGA